MVYEPMVPSELVVNEAAWREYKEWLASPGAAKCVVMGKPSIGKETTIRLINRIHNYKELYTDGVFFSREEIQERIKDIEKASCFKDIKGRSRVFLFRDVDKNIINQILDTKNKQAKIVVILDDALLLSKAYYADSSCVVIKMYSDAGKTHQRVENICRKLGVILPEEISKRIVKEGEKIGKSVSDVKMFSVSQTLRGHRVANMEAMGYIEALDKILHRRGEARKSYSEVEKICKQVGAQFIQDMLFTNYLKKCLSVEDACTLSEYSSRYDTIGSNNPMGYDVKSISAYQFHNLLYNTIFVSFKSADKKVNPKQGKPLLYYRKAVSHLQTANIREIVSVLVRKVKNQRSPSQTDEYTKKHIRYILNGIEDPSFIGEKDYSILKSIDAAPGSFSKALIPRYIYKDGHSHYVTRDISLSEIIE